MYISGASVDSMVEALGRQDTAILKRIDKRQLQIQMGKPANHSGQTQAGSPCPGPANKAWIAYSELEKDDELLRPHPFKTEQKLADGTVPTRCGTCSFDPAKSYGETPVAKKKSKRSK